MGFEHMPVNFHGFVTARNYEQGSKAMDSKAVEVRDRIEHRKYLKLVKHKPLILEFASRQPPMQSREDYDFLEEAVKQKKYLESILENDV